MKWVNDPKAEFGMRDFKISWKIEDVNLEDIDMELSQHHQARLDKNVNEKWVLDFALAMENGAHFPMCILNKLGHKKKYFIWSGIHRSAAAAYLGEKTIQAYVVEVKDQRLSDILPRVVNTWEGHREDPEAIITHAIFIVEKHGFSVPEVAKMFALDVKALQTALRARGVATEIEQIGIKKPFAKSMLIKLSPLADNRNVLGAVVKLLDTHKVIGNTAVQILDDVKAQNTELQKLAEVARWERTFEQTRKVREGKVGKVRCNNRSRLIDKLTSFRKFLDKIDSVTQLQLDDESARVAVQYWGIIQEKMCKLMKTGAK